MKSHVTYSQVDEGTLDYRVFKMFSVFENQILSLHPFEFSLKNLKNIACIIMIHECLRKYGNANVWRVFSFLCRRNQTFQFMYIYDVPLELN